MMVQQDGATSHTSNRSITILRNLFPDRLISLRGDIGWPHAHQICLLAIFFPLGVYQIASLQTQANQFAVVENLNILGN